MSVAPTLATEPEYAKVEQKVDKPSVDITHLSDVYYLDEIADHILRHDYKTPCLQFPDDLVRDSTHVASGLQEKIGKPVYVLADTSYSPCCVDEIAAQHVNGDVVFHFGNACLNPTRTLPAVYVSRKNIDADSEPIRKYCADKGQRIILYPDTRYTDLAFKVAESLPEKTIVVAAPTSNSAAMIPALNPASQGSFEYPEIPNRKLSREIDDMGSYEFIYLTDSPSESLLLHWSTVFHSIYVINGQGGNININSALRKRYRYVQQIKAAGTIGILVNTLSLRDTASLLGRVKQSITNADKKYYMFVVGKPNVAKLGNFEVVDVWVILGCPQGGIIVDDAEYVKPIVTPYELELAFNDEWTGKWLLNFNEVLQPTEQSHEDSEEPLFDLVTGKFVFNNAPLRKVSNLSLDGREVQISSNALTIRNTVSTAADKLQQKSWRGLGSDHDEITGDYAELKKGRSGIARNYQEQGH